MYEAPQNTCNRDHFSILKTGGSFEPGAHSASELCFSAPVGLLVFFPYTRITLPPRKDENTTESVSPIKERDRNIPFSESETRARRERAESEPHLKVGRIAARIVVEREDARVGDDDVDPLEEQGDVVGRGQAPAGGRRRPAVRCW